MSTEMMLLAFLVIALGGSYLSDFWESLSGVDAVLYSVAVGIPVFAGIALIFERFSKNGRERQRRTVFIQELPSEVLSRSDSNILMGMEQALRIPIFLPDTVRARHVHILGATGSGKTESVVLNFLKQDVERGKGGIILDAKGDVSMLRELRRIVPEDRLKVFDLGSEQSLTYDPLEAGNPLEAAQRLFASLTWSEEYYRSKANSVLQELFQIHWANLGRNPSLRDLADYLSNAKSLAAVLAPTGDSKFSEREFMDLSGLRDQVRSLCAGYLSKTLSPASGSQMNLKDAETGAVLYFRLQSLLSPELVVNLGKLIINHLSHLAGTAHRDESSSKTGALIPVYLDEFASFASPAFMDLISKARSAGFALHFSHQSIGDLADVKEGFLNTITDNASTKIVLRIYDPDSADFLARAFGTELYQKITQRITNVKEIDLAETVGEGTQREAHRFRAAPDLFKTLPTGVGAVLMAHGVETPHGGSSVFRIRFPRLTA